MTTEEGILFEEGILRINWSRRGTRKYYWLNMIKINSICLKIPQ